MLQTQSEIPDRDGLGTFWRGQILTYSCPYPAFILPAVRRILPILFLYFLCALCDLCVSKPEFLCTFASLRLNALHLDGGEGGEVDEAPFFRNILKPRVIWRADHDNLSARALQSLNPTRRIFKPYNLLIF